MNYEKMSNELINNKVASYFYDSGWLSRHVDIEGMIPDYCNDPSEAWPIIVSNEISIININDYWFAGIPLLDDEVWSFIPNSHGDYVKYESYNKKPLRAAMICFLKMKEGKRG